MEKESFIIFGRNFSRRELFWNGVAFLLIGVAYDVITIANQLPSGWKEDISLLNNIQQGWMIQMFFFIVSYILIDRAVFGKNIHAVIEKYGLFGYLIRKISVTISLILINTILKIAILIIFF